VGRTLLSAAFAFAVALDFALALGQEDLASEDLPSEDSDQPDWDQKGKIKPSQAKPTSKSKTKTTPTSTSTDRSVRPTCFYLTVTVSNCAPETT
jgi:hypothetical protein